MKSVELVLSVHKRKGSETRKNKRKIETGQAMTVQSVQNNCHIDVVSFGCFIVPCIFYTGKNHYASGSYHAIHVLFPGPNHLLTTGADGPGACVIIKVSGHQYQWLAGG